MPGTMTYPAIPAQAIEHSGAATRLAFEIDRGWFSIPVTGISEILDGDRHELVIPRLPPEIAGLLPSDKDSDLLPLIDVVQALRLAVAEGPADAARRHEALTDRIIVFEIGGVRAGIRCDRVSSTVASGTTRAGSARQGAPHEPLPRLHLDRLLRRARLDPDPSEVAWTPPPRPKRILTTQLGDIRVGLDVDQIGDVAGAGRADDDSGPLLDLATWFRVDEVAHGITGRKLLQIGTGPRQARLLLGSTVHIRRVEVYHAMPAGLGRVAHEAGVAGLALDQTGQRALVADVPRLVDEALATDESPTKSQRRAD